MAPETYMDSKSLDVFQSISPKDKYSEKFAQWFRIRCCLKKLWTDGQTDDKDRDGRWLITIANLEPSAQVNQKRSTFTLFII